MFILSSPALFLIYKKTKSSEFGKVLLVLFYWGRLLMVCAGLWLFTGGLWWFVVVCGRCLF